MAFLPSISDVQDTIRCWFTKEASDFHPITVLAISALMPFQEDDSKVLFGSNHEVSIQKRSDYTYTIPVWKTMKWVKGFFQEGNVAEEGEDQPPDEEPYINCRGIIRFIKRASREDLAFINPGIIRAAQWYDSTDKSNVEVRELLQHAKDGFSGHHTTYKDKSGLTEDALKHWRGLIDTACGDGFKKTEPLDGKTRKIKDVWTKVDIGMVNTCISQMKLKQGDTPISEEVKCEDDIRLLEVLLQQKATQMSKVHKE